MKQVFFFLGGKSLIPGSAQSTKSAESVCVAVKTPVTPVRTNLLVYAYLRDLAVFFFIFSFL